MLYFLQCLFQYRVKRHVLFLIYIVESSCVYHSFPSLSLRMMAIAPNLTTMVGELVGARLIAHAGSLLNLAKHPSSTVQILGAEKALFRCVVCVCVCLCAYAVRVSKNCMFSFHRTAVPWNGNKLGSPLFMVFPLGSLLLRIVPIPAQQQGIYANFGIYVIGERERANLIVQRARFFWYIYIYLSRAMPYCKPSTRFQINATHDISQKFTTCV